MSSFSRFRVMDGERVFWNSGFSTVNFSFFFFFLEEEQGEWERLLLFKMYSKNPMDFRIFSV